ncbi:MAG TPA: FIST N-terminal domain-containing protein [Saprospiraceae bacterium]|nr:FIST N-terminal domain-containing protein [Saprospiraceae bacterium]
MKAKSIKGNSPEEIKSELIQSMTEGFIPTLAIVFISVHQDRDAVSQVLQDAGIAIYGATTNGEFIDEEIGKNSIAILLLDINRDYFMVMFEAYPEKNYREITQNMARQAIEKFTTPAFLIAGSNLETDAEQLLFGFEDIVGKQVNVFGGMAGDDFTFIDQFVFTNGWSSNRGIVVVVLDENKIKIKGIATCGWKAMGTEKTVTKSEGNRVYTIENIPVLELTQKYSGIENLNKDNSQLMVEIATQFPLQLQREKGAPVMRPGLVVNWEDGSFICSGSIPQGAKVRFSLPPDLDVIDKVVDGLERLKETEMPEGDAVIVYSCAGRLMSLGPLMSKEIEGVKNIWNVPMVGMFSNSELARATDGNLEMNNLTTCCVILKEK